MDFRKELETLINRHSRENGSDTPDWILAEYLVYCLEAFDKSVLTREKWYGRKGLSEEVKDRDSSLVSLPADERDRVTVPTDEEGSS